MLAEKSWGGLWGEILNSDFPNGNELLQMENEDANGTSIHNVEEGIEFWANHEMPSMIDPLLDSQDSGSDPAPEEVPANNLICYGMVSRNLSLLSSTTLLLFPSTC